MADIDYQGYGLTPVQNQNIDYAAHGLIPVGETSSQKPPIDIPSPFNFVGKLGRAEAQVGKDILGAVSNIPKAVGSEIKAMPEQYQYLKQNVPAAFQEIKNDPMRALKNVLAGGVELTGRVSRIPPALGKYLAHIGLIKPETASALLPESVSAEEVSKAMNKFIGEEKPGDEILRGIVRNLPELYGAGKVASALNPMQLTAKNIAKSVVGTEAKQIEKHTKLYNKLWNEAQLTGFNNVPADMQRLSNKLTVIEKYKTPREYQSLEDFIISPTLENAQKAQSDMKQIARKMEEKSRSSSLTTEERSVYEAAKEAEKHIQDNMFKDAQGNINTKLQDEYKKITSSYLENVVPYRYNADIQSYKAREMLAKELIQRLKGGEFAAKKGGAHTALKIRSNILPALGIAGGIGGTIAGADWLKNKLLGTGQGEM